MTRAQRLAAAGAALALLAGGGVAYAATTPGTATCTSAPTITDGTSTQSIRVTCSWPKPAPVTSTVTTTVTVTAPPTTATPSTTTPVTTTTTPAPTTSTATPAPSTTTASAATPVLDYYGKWANGPREFPFGVWMQDPSKYNGDVGAQYKALGVNAFVGIWNWPDDSGTYAGHAQDVLNSLAADGSWAMAGLGGTNRTNGDRIRGSILRDEPDMDGTTTAQLASDASNARSTDPTRPTFVNFSKGIVDGWNNGVAVSDADKAAYCASADIPSVDFYGFTDPWEGKPGAPGYARAIDALRAACGNSKPLWGFVETTRPFDSTRITPDQFEVAVWTLIAAGADGVEIFPHDFGPNGTGEDALLYDPAAQPVKDRVKVVAAQVHAASALLNQADAPATSSNTLVRVLGKSGGYVVTNLSTAAQTANLSTPCGAVTVNLAGYEHRAVTCP